MSVLKLWLRFFWYRHVSYRLYLRRIILYLAYKDSSATTLVLGWRMLKYQRLFVCLDWGRILSVVTSLPLSVRWVLEYVSLLRLPHSTLKNRIVIRVTTCVIEFVITLNLEVWKWQALLPLRAWYWHHATWVSCFSEHNRYILTIWVVHAAVRIVIKLPANYVLLCY